MNSPQTEYYFSGLAIILISTLLTIITGTFIYFICLLFIAGLYIVVIICLLSLYLFLPVFFKSFKYTLSFIKGTPALILTNEELVDNINNQVYKWADIKTISQASAEMANGANGYIAISLAEPDGFINACKNPYKRFILRLNEKYFKGAFSIQPNIIKCKKGELLNTLVAYYEENKNI